MVQQCMKNRASDRPTIQQVLEQLEQARADIGDDGCSYANKLTFAQLLQSKDEQINQQRQEIKAQNERIEGLKKKVEAQNKTIDDFRVQTASSEDCIQQLSAEMAVLKVDLYII